MRVPEPMPALHALTEWAMAGALFAMRRFSWSPSQD